MRLIGANNTGCLADLSLPTIVTWQVHREFELAIKAQGDRKTLSVKRLKPIRALQNSHLLERHEITRSSPSSTVLHKDTIFDGEGGYAHDWWDQTSRCQDHTGVRNSEFDADSPKTRAIIEFDRLPSNHAAARAPEIKRRMDVTASTLMNRRRQHHACEIVLPTKHLHSVEKKALRTMLVLVFRCGLRLGEILKLQHKDLHHDWLYVRSNPYGDNESAFAARRVPWRILFNSDEVVFFKDYLDAAKVGGSRNELIFEYGFGRKWASGKMSTRIGGTLKSMSGDDAIAFHSL